MLLYFPSYYLSFFSPCTLISVNSSNSGLQFYQPSLIFVSPLQYPCSPLQQSSSTFSVIPQASSHSLCKSLTIPLDLSSLYPSFSLSPLPPSTHPRPSLKPPPPPPHLGSHTTLQSHLFCHHSPSKPPGNTQASVNHPRGPVSLLPSLNHSYLPGSRTVSGLLHHTPDPYVLSSFS